MEELQITSAAGMDTVAAALLTKVPQDDTGAVVIALSGDLGAGKTTLVQALAKQLKIAETITSPTYVVMKKYEVPQSEATARPTRFTNLVHIDAYRIEDVDEMRVLRFAELLQEKGTIMCIEWPEHIAPLIPTDAIRVAIAIAGEGRTISIDHAS